MPLGMVLGGAELGTTSGVGDLAGVAEVELPPQPQSAAATATRTVATDVGRRRGVSMPRIVPDAADTVALRPCCPDAAALPTMTGSARASVELVTGTRGAHATMRPGTADNDVVDCRNCLGE
ncbi:MAG: hypothetical protein NVS3B26_16080 [Mycobacteriales bacterium]